MVSVSACLQGNGGTGPPAPEEGVEEFVGGTYVRFDAPKAKLRRSWPGVRGSLSFNLKHSLLNYPLTRTDGCEIEMRPLVIIREGSVLLVNLVRIC